MKCEKFIEGYLLLDNGQKPSLLMRAHSHFCKNCREEARALDAHFEEIRAMTPVQEGRDLVESVMDIIKLSHIVHVKKLSSFQWVTCEGIILASIVLVQFSPAKIWLDAVLGEVFHVIMSVTFGVIITLFTAVLVITHIAECNDLLMSLKNKFVEFIR